MTMNRLTTRSTSLVALAAYLHDLGKFAERAGAFEGDPRLDAHLTLYCPYHSDGRWFSHRHAACTALAFDVIERHLPDLLRGDVSPFTGRTTASDQSVTEATDSLINASAAHHKPQTFLQWIIATADRVASGFEREEFERYNEAKDEDGKGLDHYTSRQLTLFEQIHLTDPGRKAAKGELLQRYPLKALSPRATFPLSASECEKRDRAFAKAEYKALWDEFVRRLEDIPRSHRTNLPLWLDHFDSLWLTYTHAIASATAFGTRPEVSLYDHSRATAALAAALWRWHDNHGQTDSVAASALKERRDFSEPKLLLVQGDFFGIQDFIFAAGGDTRKHAAKLLRGRSFQVSLFTELAGLKVLDRLGLPPTSQVINVAGKFLIVAPNTPDVRDALPALRAEFDEWFLTHTFGQAGIGLAWEEASCNDFLRGTQNDTQTPFRRLMTRLRQSLDRAKYQRLGLCEQGARVFEVDFPLGVCDYNGRLPADRKPEGGSASCALSRDQIRIGEALVRFDRLLVVDVTDKSALREGPSLEVLELDLFGYTVAFTAPEDASGRFGALADNGALRRCWDFSLPVPGETGATQPLWSGYARRYISGHVPRMTSEDLALAERYAVAGIEALEIPGADGIKPLDLLACEDSRPEIDRQGKERWLGVAALGVLKGDMDDLGEVFRIGLERPTFAKWAALSRQVNAFFAIHLPWLLASEFRNVYTVFAGGDDFFLVGPWRTVQKLAHRMQQDFTRYVADNAEIHFSAGIVTQKPGAPIPVLAELAEDALMQAKANGKNALACFGEVVRWASWPEIEKSVQRLDVLREQNKLSTGFVYGLMQFVEMRQQEKEGKPESALWRSRLAYRTRRFVVDKLRDLNEDALRLRHTELVQDIGNRGIDALAGAYRIVLFNHLYQYRSQGGHR